MNFFDSLEAVRAFAGPDSTVPVFEPEARQLLSKVEPRARHYEVKTTPEGEQKNRLGEGDEQPCRRWSESSHLFLQA